MFSRALRGAQVLVLRSDMLPENRRQNEEKSTRWLALADEDYVCSARKGLGTISQVPSSVTSTDDIEVINC